MNSFPPGTIFTVSLHPLRNGDPAGARQGVLFKCPVKTPPAASKNCDTVTGHEIIGGDVVPPPQTTTTDPGNRSCSSTSRRLAWRHPLSIWVQSHLWVTPLLQSIHIVMIGVVFIAVS